MTQKMRVSVIIPSLYEVDGEYLKLCVESLRATTDWDIIVVTNGSKVKPSLAHINGITKHLHTSDQGQCIAANIGAQNANGEYLMISNADMYYAPNWNKNLRFTNLVFSPNLIEPSDNPGSAPPFLKRDWGLTLESFNRQRADEGVRSWLAAHRIHRITPEEGGHKEEPGFNLPFFINRDVWNRIGGYDNIYDPWGSNSDTDLQTKVNLAGITPMRLRDVLVYHFGNKSGTFDGSHKEAYDFNWDYFDEKWGFNRDVLGSDVWYNKDMLPEDVTLIKYKPEWAGLYAPE